jgi:predicted RNA-binding protein
MIWNGARKKSVKPVAEGSHEMTVVPPRSSIQTITGRVRRVDVHTMKVYLWCDAEAEPRTIESAIDFAKLISAELAGDIITVELNKNKITRITK